MVPTILALIGIVFFGLGIAVYLWPRPKLRFSGVFIATFGALVGSLVGRVVADPHWQGHLLFLVAGAFLLSIVESVPLELGALTFGTALAETWERFA